MTKTHGDTTNKSKITKQASQKQNKAISKQPAEVKKSVGRPRSELTDDAKIKLHIEEIKRLEELEAEKIKQKKAIMKGDKDYETRRKDL